MPPLPPDELTALRRQVGDGVTPITWDKPTVNAALQGVEDVLEAQAFDATTLVNSVTVSNPRAQVVAAALNANQYAPRERPVYEDWLADNPASATARSKNAVGIAALATANVNQPAFAAAVAGMAVAQRERVIEVVVGRRVEVAV